jgi:transposase
MPRSVRIYTCEQCGVRRDRDHNASLNILQTAIGRDGVVLGTEKPPDLSVGSRHYLSV